MSTETTTKRLPNGQHQLIRHGKVVGRVWRWPVGSGRLGKRRSGYGVHLEGWYWRKSGPNQRGGITATSAQTIRAACELADGVLGQQGEMK